jgi:hypothetical protein
VLGRDNIEYVQADVVVLGSFGRWFDLIESGGALHQLVDRFVGCLCCSRCDPRFIGYELDLSVLRQKLGKFPADTAMVDVASWDAFERGNLDTFSAMHRFAQKKP